MGKAAKKIIDGLKAAKITAATQKRIGDLIDEAHDWDAKQAERIEVIVRYVCGVPGTPKPTPGKEELEHRCAQLLHALSKETRTLDDFDLRALDVICQAKGMYWFWELESWARERAVAFPKERMLEETLAVLRERGLWLTDDEVLHAMFGHLAGHVTEEGEVTSTGRWMLSKLDADARAVFAAGLNREKGKRLSSLYKLLVVHRPVLFDELLKRVTFDEDSKKSFLAEVMLNADAKRYEAKAVALMDGLSDAIPSLLSARNLEKHFPGKYRALVKALLIATVKAKDTSWISDDDGRGTRLSAIFLGGQLFGDEVQDLWRAYSEENDALRLDFYALIEKQAGAKSLPFLIEGLVYPKDPSATYGFVTHAKYVARMVKLVSKYALSSSDRERIESAFAPIKVKKIREELGVLLGGKSGPASKKKKVAKFDGKNGYRFDAYCAAVVKAALAGAKKQLESLPSPIQSVKLGGHQGQVQLNALLIEGLGEPVAIEFDPGKTKVPTHCDELDDDRVLERWVKTSGLGEDDDVPSWGDMYELPWCALISEQISAVEAIAAGLKKLGCKLSKDCKLGVGEYDNFWTEDDGFDAKTREGIAALPKEHQANFAAVCFENAKKQKAVL